MAAFKTNADTQRTPRVIALAMGTDPKLFAEASDIPEPSKVHQPCAPMTAQDKVPVLKPYR